MMPCMDCNLSDDDMPLDTVLTLKQWLMICPDAGGMLCATCIVKRAAKLPNVTGAVLLRIQFVEDHPDDLPGPESRLWQYMKALDGEPIDDAWLREYGFECMPIETTDEAISTNRED